MVGGVVLTPSSSSVSSICRPSSVAAGVVVFNVALFWCASVRKLTVIGTGYCGAPATGTGMLNVPSPSVVPTPPPLAKLTDWRSALAAPVVPLSTTARLTTMAWPVTSAAVTSSSVAAVGPVCT